MVCFEVPGGSTFLTFTISFNYVFHPDFEFAVIFSFITVYNLNHHPPRIFFHKNKMLLFILEQHFIIADEYFNDFADFFGYFFTVFAFEVSAATMHVVFE